MAKHNELGKRGELIARTFLEAKGFEILETNWRHEKDEIDIIAKDGDELVIVAGGMELDRWFNECPKCGYKFKKEEDENRQ